MTSFSGAFRAVISSFWIALVCVSAFCLTTAIAGTALVGPSPYLTFTNSAFDISGFEYFYLETCEDGLINTPGISLNSGWLVNVPGIYADSVDADDGVIDGSGITGHSFLAGNINSNLIVTFNAAELGGHLPTHVGVVCTDIGNVFFGAFGVGNVTLSAYDATNGFLGSVTATNFGNGLFEGNSQGATAEDRFFGVTNSTGISKIILNISNSKDWEADHLQYGYFPSLAIAPPSLKILANAPGSVVLAWPTNAVGFLLQETPILPATNWVTVPIAPIIVSDQNQVTIAPLSSNRFYRLISP